jgi:hypothetical protein
MEEPEELKKSKFNTAVSKEVRRSELWKDANNHSRNGQYARWNDDLDCIWSELCADIKDETKFKTRDTEIKAFDKKIETIGQFKDKKTGFNKLTKEQIENRGKHYLELRNKEIWLRRLENELGKGTAYEDDDEDSF